MRVSEGDKAGIKLTHVDVDILVCVCSRRYVLLVGMTTQEESERVGEGRVRTGLCGMRGV